MVCVIVDLYLCSLSVRKKLKRSSPDNSKFCSSSSEKVSLLCYGPVAILKKLQKKIHGSDQASKGLWTSLLLMSLSKEQELVS